jgi:hypothetical protein
MGGRPGFRPLGTPRIRFFRQYANAGMSKCRAVPGPVSRPDRALAGHRAARSQLAHDCCYGVPGAPREPRWRSAVRTAGTVERRRWSRGGSAWTAVRGHGLHDHAAGFICTVRVAGPGRRVGPGGTRDQPMADGHRATGSAPAGSVGAPWPVVLLRGRWKLRQAPGFSAPGPAPCPPRERVTAG